MKYIDVLSNVGLTIEQYAKDSNIKDSFTSPFLNSFKYFYSQSSSRINELDEKNNDSLERSKNILLDYYEKLHLIDEELQNEKADLETVKYSKDEEIHQDILVQNESYNNQINDENRKISNIKIKTNAEIDAKKATIIQDNSLLDSKDSPNEAVYNYYIEYFNKHSDDFYKSEHSNISKAQYSLIDANSNLVKHLDEKNTEYQKIISVLKRSIKKANDKLQEEVYQIETELNDSIKAVVEKYDVLKKQNETQTQLEINDIRLDVSIIEDKYAKIIKQINQSASSKLQDLDSNFDKASKNIKQQISDLIYHNNIKTKIDLEEINRLKEEMRKDSSSLSLKGKLQRKNEIKRFEAECEKERLIRERNILNVLKEEKRLAYSSLLEKQTVDTRRKYQINVKTYDEANEKYPLLKKISVSENDKVGFNKTLENSLNIEINKLKLQAELKILELQAKFNLFESKTQIEIASKELDSDYILVDKKLAERMQELILNKYDQEDKLSKQNQNNSGLLNIEKNKHLLNMNKDLIRISKENNNLYLNHFNSLKNIEEKKVVDICQENINYNNLAINMYRYIKNNEVQANTIDFKYHSSLREANKNLTISTEKREMQMKRRDIDIELMEENLSLFYYIAKEYKTVFLPQFSDTIASLKNGGTIPQDCKEYFYKIISCFIEIIEEFNNREQKILDDHIRLDTGTKYNTIYSNIDYSYSQKISSEEKEISQLKETIVNYQNGIASFYSQIKDRAVQISQESNYSSNSKNFDKELKKRISDYKTQINSYQDKITQNNNKIISLKKEVVKHTKKISILSRERLHAISKTRISEKKESIVSIKTIDRMNETTKKYINFFREINRESFLTSLVYNDNNLHKFYSFIKRVELGLENIKVDFKRCISDYKNNLTSSLYSLKKSYDSVFNNSIELINKENKKDIKYNKSEALRLEKNFYQNSLNHRENVNIINNKISSMLQNEARDYDKKKSLQDAQTALILDEYFLRFKSCDDLMKYSQKKYDNKLLDLSNKQEIDTQNLLQEMSNLKAKSEASHNQTINKYQHEIEIIDKTTALEKDKRTDYYTQTNENLNKDSFNIKISLKSYLAKSHIDTETYQRDNKKRIHEEFFNYKKNIAKSEAEFKAHEHEIAKMVYKTN